MFRGFFQPPTSTTLTSPDNTVAYVLIHGQMLGPVSIVGLAKLGALCTPGESEQLGQMPKGIYGDFVGISWGHDERTLREMETSIVMGFPNSIAGWFTMENPSMNG